MELDDTIAFQEERPAHYWHSQIPHCVEDADLDPYEMRVYLCIKRICGENDRPCFQSEKKLAEHCKMSERKLQMCLKNLCQKNKKLGVPLLKKTARYKENKSKDTSLYHIVDIWYLNNKFYKKSVYPGACGAPPLVHEMHHPGAPHAYKEELYKNNSLEEEHTTTKPPPKKAPENPDARSGGGGKKMHTEENSSAASPPVNKYTPIFFTNARGIKIQVYEEDIYRHFLKSNFTAEIIASAIEEAKMTQEVVVAPLKYIEAICFRLQKSKVSKNDHPEWDEKKAAAKKKEEEYKRKVEELKKIPKIHNPNWYK